jgi:hypothetical protein
MITDSSTKKLPVRVGVEGAPTTTGKVLTTRPWK